MIIKIIIITTTTIAVAIGAYFLHSVLSEREPDDLDVGLIDVNYIFFPEVELYFSVLTADNLPQIDLEEGLGFHSLEIYIPAEN